MGRCSCRWWEYVIDAGHLVRLPPLLSAVTSAGLTVARGSSNGASGGDDPSGDKPRRDEHDYRAENGRPVTLR